MSVIGAFRTLDAARHHGLRLHLRRLLQAPAIASLGQSEGDPGDSGGRESYRLRGVVCGVCATRTESALASVAGVESAAVDLGGSRAVLRLSPGAQVDVPALQRALESAVVGMSMRRRLEGAARRLVRIDVRGAGRTP